MSFFYKLLNNFYYRNSYVFFNKKHFKKINIKETDVKILIEFNAFHDSHVCLSVFSNYFREKYHYNIVAFFNYSLLSADLYFSLFNKIKWWVGNFFLLKNFGIYKSFNTDEIIRPVISKHIVKISKKYFLQTIKKIKNKNDILNLKINNILIGDLLYDTYLKSRVVPTIDIHSKDFRNFYLDFIRLLLFWIEYFNNNQVKIIAGVHSVYSYALPLRVAINNGIPAYIVNTNAIIKYSKDNMFGTPSCDFKNYKKNFKKVPKQLQRNGLKISRLKLHQRFQGVTGANINMDYADKSSFSSIKDNSVLKSNNKFKILICTHDFFDSPHLFGKFLFSDYYEWLNYLGELSKQTDFDWYIKNHPSYGGKFQIYQKFTNDVVFKMFNNHPKIKILPNDISHKQLIKDGIKAVLTGYGTVAMEYAYFSIPTINAFPMNPYMNYKFTFSPSNISKYKSIINKLDKIKLKVNKKEIFEYYFMKNLLQRDDWLGLNYQKILSRVGGYHYLRTFNFYKFWINYYNNKTNKKIYNNISSFLNSKSNYFLSSG
jgi:hypothetical protein